MAAAQSAMEYLITYGWAVLIIAVVLAVLFQLGFFSSASIGPKLPPGGCTVQRSANPMAEIISLEGVCSGLDPEYVASFGPSVSYQVIVGKEFFQDQSFTILGWMYWPANVVGSNYDEDIGYAWSGDNDIVDEGFGIFVRSNPTYGVTNPYCEDGTPCWYLNFYSDDLECESGPLPGHWYQFGASWNAVTMQQTIWVDGQAACNRTSTGDLMTNSVLYIGSAQNTWNTGAFMNGWLSNVQLYNVSLPQNDVSQLYAEGIGGPPLVLQNLVLWLPLNGNPTDYSGLNVTTTAENVIGNGVWDPTYAPT